MLGDLWEGGKYILPARGMWIVSRWHTVVDFIFKKLPQKYFWPHMFFQIVATPLNQKVESMFSLLNLDRPLQLL